MELLRMPILCTGTLFAIVLSFSAMGDPVSAVEPEALSAPPIVRRCAASPRIPGSP